MDRVGIAGDANDKIRIMHLHGTRCAPQGNDAAGAAERDLVEPARADAEMLRQSRRAVGPERKTGHREAVDIAVAQPAALQHLEYRSYGIVTGAATTTPS